ncbi:MAG TPA: choice-of-anchor P family protein [Terriglobales bacterium]|nr:MAG: hypothetical protein DMG33_16880 [Acidobacteriota bacterium]HLB86824.1 choice-of-anchor P family protein [Terriglobales bacterium]
MYGTNHHRTGFVAVAVMLLGLLAWPATAQSPTASTVTGQGVAVQATVFGILGTATTTALADTGVIGATNLEQDVGQDTGSVASLLTADVLSSSTYSYADEVDSVSSLGDLNLNVGSVSITADSVMAEASQVLGAPGSGSSFVDNLAINGVPIAVTGDPNQTVAIPGGQIVINEQTISSTGQAVVNALHVTVTGIADVVLASASAGIS